MEWVWSSSQPSLRLRPYVRAIWYPYWRTIHGRFLQPSPSIHQPDTCLTEYAHLSTSWSTGSPAFPSGTEIVSRLPDDRRHPC